jgi:membrane-bound lytic murein transglycosylase B
MSRRLLLFATFALAAALAATTHAAPERTRSSRKAPAGPDRGVPYAGNEQAMRWADELAQRRGLDPEWVRQTLAQARFLPVVARLMQPAPTGTAKNWRVYRSRFIDPVRIAAGVRFWQDNRATLERAQQQYGVPPEIVVGIVGVETIYGQQMGNFRVLDSLATLAFDFPANHPRAAERSAYFRGELEQFLVVQAQSGGDPLQPLGSYAGAMGMPQFMPSSLRQWAVDFDGDGRIDLRNSAADVIGSVANYFKSYGWKPGMPAYYPVSFDPARLDKDALLAPDILPTFSVASFMAKGAVLQGAALQHQGPLALVELQNGDDPPQYVAGTDNFYAITRYNWSSYYAMAVLELGQTVKDVVAAQDAAQAALAATPMSAPQGAAPAAPAASAPAAQAPAAPTIAEPEPPPADAAPGAARPD